MVTVDEKFHTNFLKVGGLIIIVGIIGKVLRDQILFVVYCMILINIDWFPAKEPYDIEV